MTLVPVKPEEIKCLDRRHTHYKAERIIEEFINSEHEAVELRWEPGEYASLPSAQSVYTKAVKRMHVNVYVIARNNKLYLLKGEVKHVSRD